MLVAASVLGDGVLWVGTMLLLPFIGGGSGTLCALQMTAVGAVNLLVYQTLKRHIGRPRPFVNCPDIRACARALDQFSFPSGHTLHAVSFGVLLTYHYPSLSAIVWPFALMVALSRMVLGLHYPSDVAVGGVIGAATAFIAIALS